MIDAVQKIKEASFTGSDGLDYVETLVALDALKSVLEQEPCGDCISRQAVDVLVDELARAISDERCFMSRGRSTASILQDILDLPSVTPQPKTGHWIYSKAVNTGEIIFSECSVCGNGESRCAKRMNYCPNCGAKMAESEGNNG